MGSEDSFIQYLLDQLSRIEDIKTRKLFAEMAVDKNDIVVAMISDDHF